MLNPRATENVPGSPVARDLSKKSFETFVFRLLIQAASTAMGIIIARTLGPAGKGLFAYAVATLGILAIVAGGQSAAVSWQYGRCKTASGPVFRVMMKYFYLVIVPVSIAVAAAGIFRQQVPLIVAALVFPFTYFNLLTLSFFLADGNVRWQNVQGLMIGGAQAITVTIACFLFPTHVDWVLGSWALPQVAMLFYAYRRVRPYAQRDDPTVNMRELFWRQLTFSLRASFNQIVWALNYQIDIFIILGMLGARAGGIYSVAVGIGQLMWFISRPLASSSLSRVSRGTKQESAYVTAACLRHALFTVSLACIALFFIGPAAIRFVYGARFAHAGVALQVILPGIVAYCAMPFFGQFFTIQMGRLTLMTIIGAISTVICAAVTVLLVPRFGLVAGAIGTSVSYVSSFAIMVVIFCRETKMSPAAIFVVRSADLRHYRTLLETVASSVFRLLAPGSRTAP